MSSNASPAQEDIDLLSLEDAEAVIDVLRATQDVKQKLRLAIRLADFEPDAARPVISMLDATAVDTKAVIELRVGDNVFPPSIAYAIFPADLVRGYDSPKLVIEFDPVSLVPFVHFESKSKVDSEAPNAVDLLKEYMPSDTVFEDRELWENSCKTEKTKLPFGHGTSLFNVGDNYSVYRVKHDPSSAAYLRRMFVFSLFFIEGARVPDESDNTWDFFIVTKRDSMEFIGYVSVYSFLYYGGGAQFETQGSGGRLTRKRVAHFVLLPPYQRQGLGSDLYLQLVNFFVSDSLVKEIEVEDPSTAFELLRDRTHWRWLTSLPDAVSLLEDYDSDPEGILKQLVEQFKLAPIQLQRVAEMYIYKVSDYKETRVLKQLIKSRLWTRNYEALRDMDPATQRERLQDAYEGVLHTHRRALSLDNGEESDEDEEEPEDERIDDLLQSIASGASASNEGVELSENSTSAASPPPKKPRQN